MEDEAGMAGLSLSVKHKRQFYYFMTGVKKDLILLQKSFADFQSEHLSFKFYTYHAA